MNKLRRRKCLRHTNWSLLYISGGNSRSNGRHGHRRRRILSRDCRSWGRLSGNRRKIHSSNGSYWCHRRRNCLRNTCSDRLRYCLFCLCGYAGKRTADIGRCTLFDLLQKRRIKRIKGFWGHGCGDRKRSRGCYGRSWWHRCALSHLMYLLEFFFDGVKNIAINLLCDKRSAFTRNIDLVNNGAYKLCRGYDSCKQAHGDAYQHPMSPPHRVGNEKRHAPPAH